MDDINGSTREGGKMCSRRFLLIALQVTRRTSLRAKTSSSSRARQTADCIHKSSFREPENGKKDCDRHSSGDGIHCGNLDYSKSRARNSELKSIVRLPMMRRAHFSRILRQNGCIPRVYIRNLPSLFLWIWFERVADWCTYVHCEIQNLGIDISRPIDFVDPFCRRF